MGLYGVEAVEAPRDKQIEIQMNLVKGVLEAHAQGGDYAQITALRGRAEATLSQAHLTGAYAEIATFLAIGEEYKTHHATEREDLGGIDIWVDLEETDKGGNPIFLAIQVKSNRKVGLVTAKQLAPDTPEGKRMLRTATQADTPPANARVIPVWLELPGGEEAEAYNMYTGQPRDQLKKEIGEALWGLTETILEE